MFASSSGLGLRAAWFLLACGFTSRAAVRFDAFLGYDGFLPQANWFPVVCEVHNDGPSFQAVVEISSQFGLGQRRRMAVELPTGTTKRLSLPVFSPGLGAQSWEARLLDERGRVRAEVGNLRPRRVMGPSVRLFAALTRAAIALPQAPGHSREQSLAVARLQPAVFPDTPLGLEGLSTIYLSSEKALELKAPQVQALLAWLRAGGRLVVGVEQLIHLQGADWLRALLPCEVTDLGLASAHATLETWLTQPLSARPGDSSLPRPRPPPASLVAPGPRPPRATAAASPPALVPDPAFAARPMQVATARLRDGEVLIGSDSQPLAVGARRGRGEVIALLFAPELEPFLSWTNRPWFWARLVAHPPEVVSSREEGPPPPFWGGISLDGVFGAMIDSRQVRKLPVGWLLLLLLAYLLVIGPFDYWWLRKIGRPMWTWLTFPAYVVLFSVLIYFIGYKLRAGETEYNELHVVDLIPGPSVPDAANAAPADWRGSTYASLYSPVNARYALASEVPVASLRGEYLGSYGPAPEAGDARIEQQPVGFRAEVAVPVWTSQLLVSQWWRRGETPLRLRVSLAGTGYEVQVENRADLAVRASRLVVSNKVFDLGQLPPRQSKAFSLPTADGQTLNAFLLDYLGAFHRASSQRHQAFGASREGFIDDVAGGAMAASFVSLVELPERNAPFIAPGSLDLAPQLDRGDAILLAWAPGYAPVPAMNRFTARRSQRDTLFRLAVPVQATVKGEAP